MWLNIAITVAITAATFPHLVVSQQQVPPGGIDQQRVSDAVLKELNEAADKIIQTQAPMHVNEAVNRLSPNSRLGPPPGRGGSGGPGRMGSYARRPQGPPRWRTRRRAMKGRHKAFRAHRVHRRANNGEQDYIDGWRVM